jgi:hypothetical protein
VYYFFVAVVVVRYETTATARWALLFIVRAFFNDTITVAVWTGFHDVRLTGMLPHPRDYIRWRFANLVLAATFASACALKCDYQNIPNCSRLFSQGQSLLALKAQLFQSRYRGRIRMTVAEHYAELAERYVAKAGNEENLRLKAEWEHLADCYAQLAEQPRPLDGSQRSSP